MATPKIPWTEREVDIVRRMYAAGHDHRGVAQVLKSRTADAIKAKADSLGIRMACMDPEIDTALYRQLMGEDPVMI